MFETVKKTLFTGIGVALRTKDEVKELIDDIVKQNKMSEEEGSRFYDETMTRYEEAKDKLNEKIESTVKRLLDKADMVSRNELYELKDELRAIKDKLDKNNQK